jgi:hypothetical protein
MGLGDMIYLGYGLTTDKDYYKIVDKGTIISFPRLSRGKAGKTRADIRRKNVKGIE